MYLKDQFWNSFPFTKFNHPDKRNQQYPWYLDFEVIPLSPALKDQKRDKFVIKMFVLNGIFNFFSKKYYKRIILVIIGHVS